MPSYANPGWKPPKKVQYEQGTAAKSRQHDPVTGKFCKGNNAHGDVVRLMTKYRITVLKAGDRETVRAVIRTLGDAAKGGDWVAAKLYLNYLAGMPKESLEISGVGGGPLIKTSVKEIQERILDALSDQPATRYAVARVFKGMADEADD